MKTFIVFVIFMSSLSVSFVQKGGDYADCVDSIKHCLQTSSIYKTVQVEVKDGLTIINGKERKLFNAPKVLEWIEQVEDEIKAVKISCGNSECYVFVSDILQATGLAVNFNAWLIVDPKTNLIFEFESLSNDERMIYFESRTKNLRYIKVKYSDNFYWNRDWDHVSYNFEINEIKNMKSKVVRSFVSDCSGGCP